MPITLRLNPEHEDFTDPQLRASYTLHIGHTWEGATNVPNRGFATTPGGHAGGGAKNNITIRDRPFKLYADNWKSVRQDYRSQIADLVRQGRVLATLEDGTVLTPDQCSLDAWERTVVQWSDLEATNAAPAASDDGVSVAGLESLRVALIEDANLGDITVTVWAFDGANWFAIQTVDAERNTTFSVEHPNANSADARLYVQLSAYTDGAWTCRVHVTKV